MIFPLFKGSSAPVLLQTCLCWCRTIPQTWQRSSLINKPFTCAAGGGHRGCAGRDVLGVCPRVTLLSVAQASVLEYSGLLQTGVCGCSPPCALIVIELLETPFREPPKISFLTPRALPHFNLSLIRLRSWSCIEYIFALTYQPRPNYAVNSHPTSFTCNETLIIIIIATKYSWCAKNSTCRTLFAFSVSKSSVHVSASAHCRAPRRMPPLLPSQAWGTPS